MTGQHPQKRLENVYHQLSPSRPFAGGAWALRVVWELRDGRLTFRALQEACGGISSSVLNERLQESGLLDSMGTDGYGLTALGRDLIEQVLPLVAWSTKWSPAITRRRGIRRPSR